MTGSDTTGRDAAGTGPARAVPVLAAEFDDEAGPRPGRPLIDAARDAGAAWVVLRVGADLVGLKATGRAAADAGLGLIVRIDDTRGLADLAAALPHFASRQVAELRDRLLVVVGTERAGKRLRSDVRWAPSAVDLADVIGVPRFLRRVAPNFVRAMCSADDLVVPADLLPTSKLPALVATLRLRGSRLWVWGDAAACGALREGPAFGLIVRS